MDHLSAMARVGITALFANRPPLSELVGRRWNPTWDFAHDLVAAAAWRRLLQVPYGCQGYGGYFSLSLMDKHYKPGMNLEEGISLIKRCIAEVRRAPNSDPAATAFFLPSSAAR